MRGRCVRTGCWSFGGRGRAVGGGGGGVFLGMKVAGEGGWRGKGLNNSRGRAQTRASC
eukprot:SAG31_NODE_2264_length_6057_cov_6.828634_3_plen_58_part_00